MTLIVPELPTRRFSFMNGRSVHRLGVGGNWLCGPSCWGPSHDAEGAVAVLRRAIDLGIELIDTADAYGPGTSEELIARALHPYRDETMIATKAGYLRPAPDAWVPCGRPDYLRQQVELSLRRLRVERLDLWHLHRVDPTVPFEDQIGVARELLDEGRIARVGLSEVTREQLDAALAAGLAVATVQNQYNVLDRRHDPVLERCEELGIGFIPWDPLASGRLAAPTGPLGGLARERGVSPSRLAIAWLLHRSPVVIPIPGTSKLDHLAENVHAMELALDPADLLRLDELGEGSHAGNVPGE